VVEGEKKDEDDEGQYVLSSIGRMNGWGALTGMS
jgi:hypothetical protein